MANWVSQIAARVTRAWIRPASARPGIDCVVRNLSPAGACLELDCPGSLPDQFSLIIRPENVRRSCRLIWRGENRLGVRFA